MKNFKRKNLLFSLCGLNCGLCPMYLDKYCPGCGGGKGNQSCSIAKCIIEREKVEYCFQCDSIPCKNYKDADKYDSFITHKNRINDIKKVKKIGIEKYSHILKRKQEILHFLLSNYNNGRKKTFFCVAINLLELEEIEYVIAKLKNNKIDQLDLEERCNYAVNLFQEIAVQKNLEFKLNRKPKKKR